MTECEHQAVMCDCQVAEIEKDRDRYRDLCFKAGLMGEAPCFACGYNGEGYFQPDRHPCAAHHHRLSGKNP